MTLLVNPLPSPPPSTVGVGALGDGWPCFVPSSLFLCASLDRLVWPLCSRYVEIYLETVRDLLEPSSINLEVPSPLLLSSACRVMAHVRPPRVWLGDACLSAPASPLHLFVHAGTCLTYWSLLVVPSTGQRCSVRVRYLDWDRAGCRCFSYSQIREDKDRGVFVDKARSVFVGSPEEMMEVGLLYPTPPLSLGCPEVPFGLL